MPETNVNQNPQVNTPITPPGHPHKWLVGVLIALSVVAVAIAAAYYFSDRMNNPQPYENEAVICTDDAKICPDGTAVGRTGPQCEFAMCPGEVDTSNWQTYRNEEFGFEFKYPENWAISGEIILDRRVVIQDPELVLPNFGDISIGVDFQVVDNKESLDLSKWVVKYSRDDGQDTNRMIDGRYVIYKTFTDEISLDPAAVAFIADQNRIIILAAVGDYINELDQILSTFRFVDTPPHEEG